MLQNLKNFNYIGSIYLSFLFHIFSVEEWLETLDFSFQLSIDLINILYLGNMALQIADQIFSLRRQLIARLS